MSIFKWLFDKPPTQDQFARMLLKRLRQSGETTAIEYDAAEFQLRKSSGNCFFLNNIYREYLRVPKAAHEDLIRSFLATWHTSTLKAPEDFADARADLMPAVRARSYLEIDIHRISTDHQSAMIIPHEVIADHLVATLVYDLPQSMMSVNAELLDKWGVTFYEAMEVAKQNLRETTRQYMQIGNMYSLAVGDGYDSSRLLLTDMIQSLNVDGVPIAMVPNRERLYVCGSQDREGLKAMLTLASEDLQHERFISGLAFQLVDNEWETWMPEDDHPLFSEFNQHRIQSHGQTYAEQKDLLDKRDEAEGTDVFVASYSAIENEKFSRIASYCTWTAGIESLLPETDLIFLIRPDSSPDELIAARGDWNTVRRVVGDLMEPLDIYPERWRVRQFPDAAMLAEIGLVEF